VQVRLLAQVQAPVQAQYQEYLRACYPYFAFLASFALAGEARTNSRTARLWIRVCPHNSALTSTTAMKLASEVKPVISRTTVENVTTSIPKTLLQFRSWPSTSLLEVLNESWTWISSRALHIGQLSRYFRALKALAMPTRQSHTKSRRGCLECKSRHSKVRGFHSCQIFYPAKRPV
jgi:hypothetical protein